MSGLLKSQIPPFLREFLETYFVSSKKRVLAVLDRDLATNLATDMGIKCTFNDSVMEIYRGIRLHFESFIKKADGGADVELTKANLGMGHTLARELIQFDVNRQDKSIIHSWSMLDQMEKNLNTFVMRLKEWYGWHFPELVKAVPDNETYTRVCQFIGNKDNLTDESIAGLEEIVKDGEVAQRILDSSRNSVGNELTETDEASLQAFCTYLVSHFNFKTELQGFMRTKMEGVAPNFTALIGENLGAKLLTHAGGLTNLSKLPASTIQILGAEKALFRALKKKSGTTPKYGHLFNSPFITKAGVKDKGKISRYLANKCAIACRLDTHLLKPTDRFGQKMREQVAQRLEQLNSGKTTDKGDAALEEVVQELKEEGLYVSSLKKRKSKKKKSAAMQEEEVAAAPEKPKKKKKAALADE